MGRGMVDVRGEKVADGAKYDRKKRMLQEKCDRKKKLYICFMNL